MSGDPKLRKRAATCLLALVLAASSQAAARADTRALLSGLVGHSKAELIQRFGLPSDAVTTIDGELLFYDALDAGRVDGRSGQGTRSGWSDDVRPYARSYSFRCRTEVVIRNGQVQAFNRSGIGCR